MEDQQYIYDRQMPEDDEDRQEKIDAYNARRLKEFIDETEFDARLGGYYDAMDY